MNKEQALDSFWNSFGLDAYDENSVSQGTEFPYITYSVATGSLSDYGTALSASLWFRDTSWKFITFLSNTISETIGYGGKVLPYDGGFLWIKRGSPFAQRMGDPDDDQIRRIVINIEVEYLSEN